MTKDQQSSRGDNSMLLIRRNVNWRRKTANSHTTRHVTLANNFVCIITSEHPTVHSTTYDGLL